MKAKYLYCVIIIIFCAGFYLTAAHSDESITFTTYYPAPYGVYSQLLANSLGVGDNNTNGQLDSGDVSAIPGAAWIHGGVRAGKGDSVTADTSNVGFSFATDGDTGMFAVGGNSSTGSDLVFKTDNVERMRLINGVGSTFRVQGDVLATAPVTSGWGGNFLGLFTNYGSLPGYPGNTYATLRTDGAYIGFSAGGAYSAYMNAAGVWTAVSDRNKKENFVEVDPQDILSKIDKLPMYKWNFKTDGPSIKHIAPVAQDFYSIFGLNGNDDKMISNIDPSGIALVGVKALSKKLKGQQNIIEAQQAEIDALKARLDKLEGKPAL